MTERVAEVAARIENVHQLDSVVTAMRGIAAARARQSRDLLAGIEAYADAISRAIGQALSLLPPDATTPATPVCRRALILFCAEQGFAGGFSDRILNAAHAQLDGAHLMLIGTRGAGIARERGLTLDWTAAMASQVGGVPAVANHLAEALYARIAEGAVAGADVVYARLDPDSGIRIENAPLIPLDFKRFAAPPTPLPPLITLEPQALIERLAVEYVYARLCEAAMQSFAAENEARMTAMSAAGNNIEGTLGRLEQLRNQVRQEEVTAEIVELTAGVEASMR